MFSQHTLGKNLSDLSGKKNSDKVRKVLKTKNPNIAIRVVVVPPGIEPGTHGFSVHCSTI